MTTNDILIIIIMIMKNNHMFHPINDFYIYIYNDHHLPHLHHEAHIRITHHLVPNLGGPDAALPALPQKGTPKSHGIFIGSDLTTKTNKMG